MSHNHKKQKPRKVISCGPVQAAVWTDNRVTDGTVVEMHSIKITKSYKKDNQWQHTTNFTTDDLPKVSVVAMEAYRLLRVKSRDTESFEKEV